MTDTDSGGGIVPDTVEIEFILAGAYETVPLAGSEIEAAACVIAEGIGDIPSGELGLGTGSYDLVGCLNSGDALVEGSYARGRDRSRDYEIAVYGGRACDCEIAITV